MRTQKTKLNRGFTIIEFVIVIAVVSILMAAVVPAFDHILNDSRRNTLSVNVETLNAMMHQYDDDVRRVSFQEACETVSSLAADSESLDEDDAVVRLSDDLGISKQLTTALFYDSEAARWVFLRADSADNLDEELRTTYGSSRYVLPVRSAEELLKYADSGMCLGLMDDLDLNGSRALSDEAGVLTLNGGFALNGHKLSGAYIVALPEDNAVAECVSGSLTMPDGETQVALRFGTEDADVETAYLIGGEESTLFLGEISVRNVRNLEVSGLLSARTLSADRSGVTLLSDAAISDLEEVAVDEYSYLKAGTLYHNGESVAYRSFAGGSLSSASYGGSGMLYCGPIGFSVSETTLIPVKVMLSTTTMEPSEKGLSYNVQDGRVMSLDGSMTYTVAKNGELALSALLLDSELRPEPTGTAYRIDRLGERSVIAAKDASVVYVTDQTGNLTPYCVCVDSETLTYLTDFDLLAYLKGEISAIPEGAKVFFVGGDGVTLYEENSSGGRVASSYSFVWGKKMISTSQFHNVIYNLYSDGGVWVQNRTTVRHGDSIILPKPLRAGYSFVRWYETEDFEETEGMEFGTRLDNITSDMELYAKWSIETSELTMTLDYSGTDRFRVMTGGLVFLCGSDESVLFRNQIEIEGETYAVYPGQMTKPDAYWYQKNTKEGSIVYEIYRGDTGVMVAAVIQPVLSHNGDALCITAYGQSMDVILPDPDDVAGDDRSFDCWVSEDDVYYAAGEKITISADEPGAAGTILHARWTRTKRAGISLAVKRPDGSTAEVTNRVYQISNGVYTLHSAQVQIGPETYQLRKNNSGVWILVGRAGEERQAETPLSVAGALFGLTDELILSSGSTMGTVKVNLSEDGKSLSTRMVSLTYGDIPFVVEDGWLLGGKLSGAISAESGADTYTYEVSSMMNKTVDYTLAALTRAGIRYSVEDDSVTMLSDENNRGKRYDVLNSNRPGASTLQLSEVLFSVNDIRCWLEVSESQTASLTVEGETQDYTVSFQIVDDADGVAYTMIPIAVTMNGETAAVENGKVTFGEEVYSVNALLGLPDDEDPGQGGSEPGEGGQGGESGEGGQGEGGQGGNEQGEGGQSGGHTHSYGFFSATVNGVQVLEYGCTSCASASENATITLTADLVLTAPLYIPSGAVYTLDLNGHNVIAGGMDAIYNCGTLTLRSDGFTLPVFETDEDGNLLFQTERNGSQALSLYAMAGYVIVNNGSADDADSNRNGVMNWGTLYVENVGVAVADTFGSAVVNAENGVLTVRNAALINTGLGNGIYANKGTINLEQGTVIWSTTYGYAVFIYEGAEVNLRGGSYYSTVGYPFCLCGGRLNIEQYCVTDRSKSSEYEDYIEVNGYSGEIYWLAGTLDTTDLVEEKFYYNSSMFPTTSILHSGGEQYWVFPEDFQIVIAMMLEDGEDLEVNQWSEQVYISATWTPGPVEQDTPYAHAQADPQEVELTYLGQNSQYSTETEISGLNGDGGYESIEAGA